MAKFAARPDVATGQVNIEGPDVNGTVLVEIGRARYAKRFELQGFAEQVLLIEALFGTFPLAAQDELLAKLQGTCVAVQTPGGIRHQRS